MDPMTTLNGLTTGQLAERWDTTQEALRSLRTRGTGPEFISLGNVVVYLLSTIEAWEQEHGPNGRTGRTGRTGRRREAVA